MKKLIKFLIILFLSPAIHAQKWTNLESFQGSSRSASTTFTIGDRAY